MDVEIKILNHFFFFDSNKKEKERGEKRKKKQDRKRKKRKTRPEDNETTPSVTKIITGQASIGSKRIAKAAFWIEVCKFEVNGTEDITIASE